MESILELLDEGRDGKGCLQGGDEVVEVFGVARLDIKEVLNGGRRRGRCIPIE